MFVLSFRGVRRGAAARPGVCAPSRCGSEPFRLALPAPRRSGSSTADPSPAELARCADPLAIRSWPHRRPPAAPGFLARPAGLPRGSHPIGGLRLHSVGQLFGTQSRARYPPPDSWLRCTAALALRRQFLEFGYVSPNPQECFLREVQGGLRIAGPAQEVGVEGAMVCIVDAVEAPHQARGGRVWRPVYHTSLRLQGQRNYGSARSPSSSPSSRAEMLPAFSTVRTWTSGSSSRGACRLPASRIWVTFSLRRSAGTPRSMAKSPTRIIAIGPSNTSKKPLPNRSLPTKNLGFPE